MPKNIPSNLSSKPPWPGKNVPVFFNFAFLFKKENNKSPIWQPMEFNIDKTIIDELIFFVIKKNKNEIVVIVNNIDPIEPEIVLLGLILVNFGPLKIFPNI